MKQIVNFVTFATAFVIIIGDIGTHGSPSGKIEPKDLEASEIRRVLAKGGEISTKCGEEMNLIAGVISYRFLKPLIPSENCLWIIKAADKVNVNFRLIYSGFEGTNASVFIYSPITASGEIRQHAKLAGPMQTAVQYNAGIFFLHFSNPPNSEGTGFMLSYDGVGSDNFALPQYTHRFYHELDAFYLHQEENDPFYPYNRFYTFSLAQASEGKKISFGVSYVSIPTDNRLNSICTGDILNVYELNYQQLHSRIKFCAEDINRFNIESTEKLFITFNAVNRTLPGRNGFFMDWEYINSEGKDVIQNKKIQELIKVADD